jgi:hypothetical protein
LLFYFSDGRQYVDHKPAAVSEARWVQHPLYTGKMQKWGKQMGYDLAYMEKLKRFNCFQILYGQFWFTLQNAANAPYTDLLFIKMLQGYAAIDPEISRIALIAFMRLLWYLMPEMAFLSLASPKVSTDEKRRLASMILTQP